MQAEKCIADDEEEKVGIIAEEVSKKQKGWIAVFIQLLYNEVCILSIKKCLLGFGFCFRFIFVLNRLRRGFGKSGTCTARSTGSTEHIE